MSFRGFTYRAFVILKTALVFLGIFSPQLVLGDWHPDGGWDGSRRIYAFCEDFDDTRGFPYPTSSGKNRWNCAHAKESESYVLVENLKEIRSGNNKFYVSSYAKTLSIERVPLRLDLPNEYQSCYTPDYSFSSNCPKLVKQEKEFKYLVSQSPNSIVPKEVSTDDRNFIEKMLNQTEMLATVTPPEAALPKNTPDRRRKAERSALR